MDNLWRDTEARSLEGIDLLVYRSRLIGRDPRLVLWGGGNTSLKHVETDFRGRPVRVMRIKGSGVDLKTVGPDGFPGIRLDDLEPLQERGAMADQEMVHYLVRCLVDPGSPRPSIETLLHGFLPAPHVDHTHADAILALTNTVDGRRHVREAFGEDAVWVPYLRPGFALSRRVAEAVRAAPRARCAVLEKHGLIAWGSTARESYDTTIAFNTRAEEYARDRARGRAVFGGIVVPPLDPAVRRRVVARLAPALRGRLAGGADGVARRPLVLRFEDSDDILEFVGSEAGPQLALAGPATPDHLMYTRARPLVARLPPGADLRTDAGIAALGESLAADFGKYADWYALYLRKHAGGPAAGSGAATPAGAGPGAGPVAGRHPRVILIPGVGLLAAGRDARRAAMVAEIYHHTIAVLRAASGIGTYESLSLQDCHDIESWPLEIYRLSLAPPGPELEGRVALVTGAASGIGRAIARRLAAEGCHVAVTDRDEPGARALADEIETAHGAGRALAARLDVGDEAAVRSVFEGTVLVWGGIDVVVSNAGFAHTAPVDRMALADWEKSFAVNSTGHFLVARETLRIFKEQGTGGSLIVNASKNVLAPGRDFAAYSAAKAAATQLARIVAIEGGEHGVRVNILNPDAVFQDSRLWSPEVREERARAHGIAPGDLEEFYRNRNLLRARVTAEDVAEAAFWLASDRSAKTTGCILTIDGGVREGFPR
jgi:rhamnulose-1-phosphate aldolase/alcohol dehydrogenase